MVVVWLNASSANVSWRGLSVPLLPVSYTVVYSRVSQTIRDQNTMNETSVVFGPPATSGVITGLVSQVTYQLQVFASVTVNGEDRSGERSSLLYFANGECTTPALLCFHSL